MDGVIYWLPAPFCKDSAQEISVPAFAVMAGIRFSPTLRQLLSWRRLVFLTVLAGIGWIVYHLLPPEPRWTVMIPQAGKSVTASFHPDGCRVIAAPHDYKFS